MKPIAYRDEMRFNQQGKDNKDFYVLEPHELKEKAEQTGDSS